MRRGTIISGFLAVLVAFVAAGSAQAYDGRIAQDLKDGRLDGKYSQAEFAAYFGSAMAQGYGNPVVTPPAAAKPVVTPPAAAGAGVQGAVQTPGSPAAPSAGVAGAQSPLGATQQTGTLPFTGIDLALLVAGGALMLGLGLGARRLGRNQ
jgi:hypothetical protein